ncbi:hypothetical protein CPS_3199 [Colwellia psychrerythraea 34H]|uniref:Uncharacterized protein n=1 Tax=Colwellia psychrerythraea (strain 34H / ATCC BAA-681) TaxID=167879 RepID=Q47Z75_COLP3|nr:hypothetical protein CPS_3199 [Colwellia psychrerythraea 34H]
MSNSWLLGSKATRLLDIYTRHQQDAGFRVLEQFQFKALW